MDERERRRQRRYREAMRNRVIAVVFLAALIVGKLCRTVFAEYETRLREKAGQP